MRVNLLLIRCFTSDVRSARNFVTTSAAMANTAASFADATFVRYKRQFVSSPGIYWSYLPEFHRFRQQGARLTIRSMRSSAPLYFSNSNDSGTKKHQLFLQQLQELESERTSLFGSMKNDTASDNTSSISTTSTDFISYINDSDPNGVPALSEMSDDAIQNQNTSPVNTTNHEDLKSDREALYGFTSEERNAWSTVGSNNSTNHTTMLRDIAIARQQQEEDRERRDKKGIIAEINSSKESPAHPTTSLSFSHLTQDQRQIHMVDVGLKAPTRRTAVAQSMVMFPPEVLQALNKTESPSPTRNTPAEEWIGPKGPIFATAITAGIMGVKQTSSLIPLCHPLPIENIHIDIQWYTSDTIQIKCTCSVTHKTGVEMEALMGCTIAALTIYDMVKAISHNVQITDTKLLYKDGGKRHVDKR